MDTKFEKFVKETRSEVPEYLPGTVFEDKKINVEKLDEAFKNVSRLFDHLESKC